MFYDFLLAQHKLYIRIPSHGLYEPVKNSQDIRERKAVRYESNLSLQDEEKLSYASYLDYLRDYLGYQGRLFKKHRKCTPAVHAQVLNRIKKIPL